MHATTYCLLSLRPAGIGAGGLGQVVGRKARIGFVTEAPLDQVCQRAGVEPLR